MLYSKEADSSIFVSWSFPTDGLRREYMKTIRGRTNEEVINLIRHFLIPSGSLGADKYSLEYLLRCDKETYNKLMKLEHYRRLLGRYIKGDVWEGNTWIIDLLPHWPKVALDALNAYFLAHCQFLPDGRIDGLSDAMALIRARFIQTPRSALLSNLEPYQFEHLIDKLYSEMGYSTTLTQKTRDGGRDVIAEKSGAAKREKLLIECKTLKRKIGVQLVRSLLGIVSDEKATKGVFVCTSTFTREARKLERRNPRLDLIDNTDLQVLLNEHLGPTWSEHVDSLISRSMARAKENSVLQNPAP